MLANRFLGLRSSIFRMVSVSIGDRVIQSPPSVPASVLAEASNYLSTRLLGRTLSEARDAIRAELDEHQVQLDELTAKVVQAGLATWSGEERDGSLIVRGQAILLEDVTALADLERIRALFEALETKETMVRLLSLADDAEGIQIFIGSGNQLFNITGCSMIVAPYKNTSEKIIGAIGVIGPTRINYARIIPMVDYTAKMIGRLIG